MLSVFLRVDVETGDGVVPVVTTCFDLDNTRYWVRRG